MVGVVKMELFAEQNRTEHLYSPE